MKSFFLLAITIVTSFIATAQEIYIDATKKISKDITPSQVVDSLIKRFPNAKAVEYYKASSQAAANGWSVSENDDLDGDDVDYYVLSFKKSDSKYYGLFKADGTLIRSSFQQSGVALPDAVKTTLKSLGGGDYKDYNLLSKTYYKSINHSDNTEYYVVSAVKKNDPKAKKTITIDTQGKVLKVK